MGKQAQRAGIAPGFLMTQSAAEKLVGRELPSRAFQWVPQGSRLLVVKDAVPDKVGEIHLANETKEFEQMGTGWIIGAGHLAGMAVQDPRMGNIQATTSPGDLVGLHIMFAAHAGKGVKFTAFDTDYFSETLMLTPMEVWMVDLAADPAQADLDADEEALKRQRTKTAKEARAAEKEEAEAVASIEAERSAIVLAKS